MSTANPTKTVDARNAGLIIDEKFSRLPKQTTSGSGIEPSTANAELKNKI